MSNTKEMWIQILNYSVNVVGCIKSMAPSIKALNQTTRNVTKFDFMQRIFKLDKKTKGTCNAG